MSTAAQRLAERRARALTRPAVDLSASVASTLISQGPRPTCVAFAVAGAHEGERADTTFQPAIEPIWWHLDAAQLTSPDGVLLSDAGPALSNSGHCQLSEWSYNELLGFGSEPPPATAGTPPWTTAQLNLWPPDHDGVEDPIENALATGHPVILIIEVTDEFFYPEPDGYVRVPPITATSGGYHAVLAVGAWTDPTHGRVLLIRNSWGDWWGAGGYCLLPLAYLIAHCVQAAQVEI